MSRIVVHGHFYQPPRENPWTGVIDPQPSAAPFHDWNERVHAECYRPNIAANIVTQSGEQTVNNLECMSFNFGPTLLRWLEVTHPMTYEAILQADQAGVDRLGHGNALAQAFHHTILPLSPTREVRTEVRWGIADFHFRFGRPPEGMWLPETAANARVLSVLIEEDIDFTILAPNQAARWQDGSGEWHDGPIDTTRPYRFVHPDGSDRSLAVWFYDGPRSRAIAFENVTSSAQRFLSHLDGGHPGDGIVHVATDGETYGHHQKWADICLAYALFVEASRNGVELSNYPAELERARPEAKVELVPGEGTSWSCAHGVGRWKEDCGCSTGGEGGWGEDWNQRWRAPLREGLEILRESADETYERLGSHLLNDPWGARDHYVDVVLGARTLPDFLAGEASGPLDPVDTEIATRLLAIQESSMAMFTSCGWFFSDVGGIETVQILRYAARTLDLLKSLDQPVPEGEFLDTLGRARSNDPRKGTAADIFATISSPRP
ncbi:MAG: DUF3536 domain-containing protein [Actinomycetota bacterium]